jgi:hypothetical protein
MGSGRTYSLQVATQNRIAPQMYNDWIGIFISGSQRSAGSPHVSANARAIYGQRRQLSFARNEPVRLNGRTASVCSSSFLQRQFRSIYILKIFVFILLNFGTVVNPLFKEADSNFYEFYL